MKLLPEGIRSTEGVFLSGPLEMVLRDCYRCRGLLLLLTTIFAIIISMFQGDVPKWLKGPHSKCGRSAITGARVQIPPSPFGKEKRIWRQNRRLCRHFHYENDDGAGRNACKIMTEPHGFVNIEMSESNEESDRWDSGAC